jgi:HemY protein
MRFGLWVTVVLIVGAIAAHFMLESNGYVLISFRGYTIEMSVPILLLLLTLSYLAIRLLVRIWNAPRALGEFAARTRHKRSGRQIIRGFIALSEGKLARGERLLTKGAADSEAPILNYLAAARTAHMQGDPERRDGWLKMAYAQESGADNAVLLTQAELQLAAGEFEQARASLTRITENRPQHPQALRLLAELHFQKRDWKELMALLPALRRAKNVLPEQLDAWTVEVYSRQLSETSPDKTEIEKFWQSLPRPLRKNIELIAARAKALVMCGEQQQAEIEIRRALKTCWNEELVKLYGELTLADPQAQLRQVESWLMARPEDPVLLLVAGRACVRSQLWGKARSYLESSIAIRPTPAAYHELGQLMLKLDEKDAATNAFAKGLTLSSQSVVQVPQITSDG